MAMPQRDDPPPRRPSPPDGRDLKGAIIFGDRPRECLVKRAFARCRRPSPSVKPNERAMPFSVRGGVDFDIIPIGA